MRTTLNRGISIVSLSLNCKELGEGVVLFTRLVQHLGDTLFKKDIQALKSRTGPGGLCVIQRWVPNEDHALWGLVPQWEKFYLPSDQRPDRGHIFYNSDWDVDPESSTEHGTCVP